MPTAIEELKFTFKTYLYEKKPKWRNFSVKEALLFFSKLEKNNLEFGYSGIYLKPILTDFNGNKHYWVILDIESQNHDSVEANLEAAKNFLYWLGEKSLTYGLKIVLSGRGLRFVWPFIVPPIYNKAFLHWISDKQNFPIDNSTQTNNSFFRIFAYRGHPNHDRNPQDIHTHLLSDFNDIWFLTKDDYLMLVSGTPSQAQLLNWFEIDFLPETITPKPWTHLFELYDRKRKLKDSIFQHHIIRRNSDRDHRRAMIQIDDYLAVTGRETQEIQTGDITIYKIIGGCPCCERTDGNPYITQSGRLKCWHANSCAAGEKSNDGSIEGLAPSEWVEGFQYKHIEDFEDSKVAKKTIHEARNIIPEALVSDGNMLITTTPGSGKTTITIKEIISAAKRCENTIHNAHKNAK